MRLNVFIRITIRTSSDKSREPRPPYFSIYFFTCSYRYHDFSWFYSFSDNSSMNGILFKEKWKHSLIFNSDWIRNKSGEEALLNNEWKSLRDVMTPNSESKTKSGCGAVMDKYCIIRWLDSLEDYKVMIVSGVTEMVKVTLRVTINYWYYEAYQ